MAFPWSRSDSDADAVPQDRRRRAGGRRARQEEARRESSRVTKERRHQRIAFGIGGVLVLVIVAVLGYGVYEEFYKPPRVWAGSVRDVEFTMGDLVQRIRVLQQLTGQVDLSTVPFEYLRDMVDAEILRQAAPGLGIALTEEHIDEALRGPPPLGFYPQVPAGQETDPGQLEREFNENYQAFLTRTGLSDEEYRVIVQEQLASAWFSAILGQGIQDPQEQVEVAWIRLEQQSGIDVEEVVARLELQDFATVANDLSIPEDFAGTDGYVGWVPQGAFPQLDSLLYGDPDKGEEPLAVGEIGNPAFTQDGVLIVRKLAGPEVQPLSDIMATKLNAELVIQWRRQQQVQGSDAGWMKMKFSSKWYSWVAEQVSLTASNLPQGQGGR
ncbi:MAG: hypothetical protein BZY88_08015 [SAR202 cluster bacterium Io17-Chloro-G9]|nr:MAG: hypothetical protein BZY88_08015 [SAR202 cluster bacterium Io17-Chloro-G9]